MSYTIRANNFRYELIHRDFMTTYHGNQTHPDPLSDFELIHRNFMTTYHGNRTHPDPSHAQPLPKLIHRNFRITYHGNRTHPNPPSECQNVKISMYRNTEFHQNPLTKYDRCIKTKEGNSRFIEDVVVGCRWVVTGGCCNNDLVNTTRSR